MSFFEILIFHYIISKSKNILSQISWCNQKIWALLAKFNVNRGAGNKNYSKIKAKLYLLAWVQFEFNWTHSSTLAFASTRAVATLSVILSILHQAKQKQYEPDDHQFFVEFKSAATTASKSEERRHSNYTKNISFSFYSIYFFKSVTLLVKNKFWLVLRLGFKDWKVTC